MEKPLQFFNYPWAYPHRITQKYLRLLLLSLQRKTTNQRTRSQGDLRRRINFQTLGLILVKNLWDWYKRRCWRTGNSLLLCVSQGGKATCGTASQAQSLGQELVANFSQGNGHQLRRKVHLEWVSGKVLKNSWK